MITASSHYAIQIHFYCHYHYRALDLRLEIAGSIPATALSSVDLGQVCSHTHVCLCHQAV